MNKHSSGLAYLLTTMSPFKLNDSMKALTLLLLNLLSVVCLAQSPLKGTVVDNEQKPIPFANVYFRNTTTGTTTNLRGAFELDNVENHNAIIISCIGFEKKQIPVSAFSGNKPLTITLQAQSVQLRTVEIKHDEDPAYAIVRNAIKQRKKYRDQVKEYMAEVYMKSGFYVDEFPKYLQKMAGEDALPDSSEMGLVFFSESVNRFAFAKPDQIKEQMIASKTSGTMGAAPEFSWNRARHSLLSFYDNNIDLGVSDRGFVSPIAANAMLFYDYKLEGFFQENGFMINKIRIIPKRKGDPVFSGFIYIVEDLWNIHSTNLRVSSDAPLEFMDSLNVSQSMIHLKDSLFMPLSVQYLMYYNFMGIKARYRALANYSEYNVEPGFPDDYFSREWFEVTPEVKKKQGAYWENNRPTVLTEEELQNYHKGDSIKRVTSSPEYRDSVDRAVNKLSWQSLLLGYSHQNWRDSTSWSVPGLLYGWQWTTLDGLAADIRPQWRKEHRTGRELIQLNTRFSSKQDHHFDAYLIWQRQFNRFTNDRLTISGGTTTRQINASEPISIPLITYYTLAERRNFDKYMRELFLNASFSRELIPGLNIAQGIKVARRQNLDNRSDYSFKKYRDERTFTPNLQAYANSRDMLYLYGSAEILHKVRYERYPDSRQMVYNKYPRLTLSYRYGKGLDSDASFLRLQGKLTGHADLNLLGRITFQGTGGFFPVKNKMDFADMKHFTGNQTALLHGNNSAFEQLAYYKRSTNDAYFYTGITHHFQGFIMNKLPLIRKLQWQTVAGGKMLLSENGQPYYETFIGIKNILRTLRVDLVLPYENGRWRRPAIQLGIDFL